MNFESIGLLGYNSINFFMNRFLN